MDRADLRHFLNLRFFAPFTSRSGYGTLARGFAHGLSYHIPELKYHLLRDFPGGTLKLPPRYTRLMSEPADDVSPLIRLDVPWRKRYDGYGSEWAAIYTMFEASPLPRDWVKVFPDSFDQVIVPSQFCKELFLESGLRNISVIRPGMNGELYNPDVAPLRMDTRSFVILFVGEFNHRKGWDVAVRSFARAFGPGDDVTLIVKTWSPVFEEERIRDTIVQTMLNTGSEEKLPHVQLLLNMIPDAFMPSLYRMANVLLMPSRSEAYGLPAAEAQACGIPVIATNHGALRELVSSESGFLIPVREMKPAEPTGMTWDFYKGLMFPEPDENYIVDLLKRLYDNTGILSDMARNASERILKRSWKMAAEELITLLKATKNDNYT